MNEHLKGKHKTLGEESMTKKKKKIHGEPCIRGQHYSCSASISTNKNDSLYKKQNNNFSKQRQEMIKLKSTELFHFLEM